jgi:hypothetical protein
MWRLNLLLVALFLLPVGQDSSPQRKSTDIINDLWLDVSVGSPLVGWFNNVARPTDIARLENASQLNLLDQITVGRKLLVFKSAAEAERLLPVIADQLDIIGYNLEHGPANPVDEQASPVASAQRMRALADEYELILAFGPDHEFALSHGVEIAPFVDIFVLQVQRVQTDPQTVYDFILPLIPKLREANPDLEISIQVRTEGDVVAIADLIASLGEELDGVSILTSPDTVPVAEALVEELQSRMGVTNPAPAAEIAPAEETVETADPPDQRQIIRDGGILILIIGGGIVALLTLFRKRA